jgi:hypothetical protein
MVTIGPDLTFARLRHALEIVGGPSKKKQKHGKNSMKA